MSLDVTLISGYVLGTDERWAIFVRENGQTKEITREEWNERCPGIEPAMCRAKVKGNVVYSANITHNLTDMAERCGLYKPLWRPEEIEIVDGIKIETADQLVPFLTHGLSILCGNPEKFKKYNPKNGWGNYELLVEFTADYIVACVKNPSARIEVSG